MSSKGGRGICSTCHADNRGEIEARIASGEKLTVISRDTGIGRDAIARHRDNHMTPTLLAVRGEQARQTGLSKTASDRVASLLEKLEALVERTHDEKRESMLLGASRELRSAIELQAKLDGSLRPENQTTVQVLNLSTSDEWKQTLGVVLDVLSRYPGAREDLLNRLDGRTRSAHQIPVATAIPPQLSGSPVDPARRPADEVVHGEYVEVDP